MPDAMNLFIGSGQLAFRDAAAALLVLPNGRYVMQLRTDRPGVFFPGFWGCFGGAMNSGESPPEALKRELREELGLDLPNSTYFSNVEFDLGFMGQGRITRHYFEIALNESDFERISLGEGLAFGALSAEDLLHRRTVPYDAYAVWLHSTRPGRHESSVSV